MTVDWKKKLIPNLPYLLFVYLFDKLCQAVRLAPGLDASEKFLHLSQGFTEAFSSGLPSLHPLDLLAGIAGAVIVRLAVYAKSKNTKKYRKGIEYGSARWGTAADIAPYVDPVPDWNIPLTQTEKLTMSSRPKNPKYARNKNILVIGVSQPALLPMSSMTMQRPWLAAVVWMRSITSVAMSTAVWKPKVTSVPQISLSMVLGKPMTFSPSSASMFAVLCVPFPPSVTRQSSFIFL